MVFPLQKPACWQCGSTADGGLESMFWILFCGYSSFMSQFWQYMLLVFAYFFFYISYILPIFSYLLARNSAYLFESFSGCCLTWFYLFFNFQCFFLLAVFCITM
jgi:hypothetical protein